MSIKNPYNQYTWRGEPDSFEFHAFNEGVKATVQYLEEPCSEHPRTWCPEQMLFHSHRYLCPDCMRQVREELGQ